MVNVHSKHYIGETLCVNMTIFLLFTKIDVVLKCLKQKEKKSTTVLYSKFNKILTTNQFSKTFFYQLSTLVTSPGSSFHVLSTFFTCYCEGLRYFIKAAY